MGSKIEKFMANKYDTYHDLQQYLSETIVSYKGEPLFCHVKDNCELMLYELSNGVYRFTINPDDLDLDISSLEVGYSNQDSNGINSPFVMYTTRIPYKKWKQGICRHNCTCRSIDGSTNLSYNNMNSIGFKNSLMGLFPSVDEALGCLSNLSCKEIAISQEIAFQIRKSGVILVFFKTEEIGFFKEGSNRIFLNNSRLGWIVEKYLSEFNWSVEVLK